MGTTGSSQQGPHGSQGDEPVDLGLLSQRTIDAVTTLCGRLPLDGSDRAELDSAMADLGAVRALCDTVDIAIARQARHLAAAGRAAPADETLARGGRRSRRDAHATAERSTVCDRLPGLEADLANGSVSTGHLDAIANATAALTDEQRERFDGHAEQLARRAAVDTPEAFARHCRHLARQVTGDDGETRLNQQRRHNRLRHWIDRDTGMYHIHCELDPETGAKVITLITAHTTTLKHHRHHHRRHHQRRHHQRRHHRHRHRHERRRRRQRGRPIRTRSRRTRRSRRVRRRRASDHPRRDRRRPRRRHRRPARRHRRPERRPQPGHPRQRTRQLPNRSQTSR